VPGGVILLIRSDKQWQLPSARCVISIYRQTVVDGSQSYVRYVSPGYCILATELSGLGTNRDLRGPVAVERRRREWLTETCGGIIYRAGRIASPTPAINSSYENGRHGSRAFLVAETHARYTQHNHLAKVIVILITDFFLLMYRDSTYTSECGKELVGGGLSPTSLSQYVPSHDLLSCCVTSWWYTVP